MCARMHQCLTGCQSYWHECSSSHSEEKIKSDNVTELSRSRGLHHTAGFAVLWPLLRPFPAPSQHVTLSAQFVSHRTASTCYCCPRAWLLVCLSVCQPASGLRRPASFIKRKQAGEITRDAGIWGQLICWQRHWGSQGSSAENKPEIYIVWGFLSEQDSSPVVIGESEVRILKKIHKTLHSLQLDWTARLIKIAW